MQKAADDAPPAKCPGWLPEPFDFGQVKELPVSKGRFFTKNDMFNIVSETSQRCRKQLTMLHLQNAPVGCPSLLKGFARKVGQVKEHTERRLLDFFQLAGASSVKD